MSRPPAARRRRASFHEMSVPVDEVDLDAEDDRTDEYLIYLVDRATTSSSLLDQVRKMPIFLGMLAVSTDPKAPHPDKLAKSEVELMLSQEHVDWEGLHGDIIHLIFQNRASLKNQCAAKTASFTSAKFSLFHKLARQFPSFLIGAGKHRRGKWTSGIDSLAGDFSRLLEDSLVKGGGSFTENQRHIGGGLVARGVGA